MGLYVHEPTGEIKRTVPGRHEDQRVQADDKWRAITDDELEQIRAAGGYDKWRPTTPPGQVDATVTAQPAASPDAATSVDTNAAEPAVDVATDTVPDEPVAVDATPDEPVAVDATPDEPVAVDATPDEPVAVDEPSSARKRR